MCVIDLSDSCSAPVAVSFDKGTNQKEFLHHLSDSSCLLRDSAYYMVLISYPEYI